MGRVDYIQLAASLIPVCIYPIQRVHYIWPMNGNEWPTHSLVAYNVHLSGWAISRIEAIRSTIIVYLYLFILLVGAEMKPRLLHLHFVVAATVPFQCTFCGHLGVCLAFCKSAKALPVCVPNESPGTTTQPGTTIENFAMNGLQVLVYRKLASDFPQWHRLLQLLTLCRGQLLPGKHSSAFWGTRLNWL